MRINKFFTDQGYCSRREADRLIESGRVAINGVNAKLGDQVSETDVVTVDGVEVKRKSKKVYLMYHKPVGVISTTDSKIEGNIIEAVGYPERVFMIGRLDKDSTGLIFLTNDGDIVNRILRARFGHEKEYQVETQEPMTDEFLKKMSSGIDIGDYVTQACPVTRLGPNRFTIILKEGKNRQIRRMVAALGLRVKKLHRVRIMNVLLGKLPLGKWQHIPETDLNTLFKQLDSAEITNQNIELEGEELE
ncbi:MAG: pseudouridine synthase [Oligoflexia bacterium]|nr:pseudouridine synthase [Oligoflexia bacterium]